MLKKTLLAICIAGVSFSSMANWVGGASYVNLSDEADGIDLSLSGISASIGYKFESQNNFYFLPELSIATGISDDTVTLFGTDINVEMDRFIVLSVRAQYELDNNIYLFVAPSYANLKMTAKTSGYESISDDEWEFGFGGGVGYNFNKNLSTELSYDQYDGTDVINVGIKYAF